jgi:hypothetical protein
VVNGCQSLTTILHCSERVRAHPEARVLVRFYEILALKKSYENASPTGYFITKRSEERPADRDETQTIDVSQLAKYLMACHCQRPNISHNEN